MEKRELALKHRHTLNRETWTEHCRSLSPLRIGDHVLVQNQTGNFPTKWDKSGIIVEVLQNHQYIVRIDGAGRGTRRNRQLLRKFTPFTPASPPEYRDTPRPTAIPLSDPAVTTKDTPSATQPWTTVTLNDLHLRTQHLTLLRNQLVLLPPPPPKPPPSNSHNRRSSYQGFQPPYASHVKSTKDHASLALTVCDVRGYMQRQVISPKLLPTLNLGEIVNNMHAPFTLRNHAHIRCVIT